MSLSIKNLSKKYGENSVLNKIEFTLNQGEIISIIGASGCGKTTLLKCITGLCDIDEGEIKINLKPIHKLPPNKRNIGYVFQESPLFPHLNIFENIVFNMKKFDSEKLDFLLDKIQIKHLKKRYPHEISGGENQRTAVIRSLIRNPDLFLLDEPFTNLDKVTKEHTKELIFDIIKETKTTTILVNHDIQDSLELSDRLLVLDESNIKMLNNSLKVYSEPSSLKIAKLFGEVNNLEIEGKQVYIRPKDVTIVTKSEIKAEVIQSNFVGQHFKITAKIGSKKITLFNKKEIMKNTQIHLRLKQENILKFD
ncbi:MAG: ABC transporter ATP-binding protein [Flavobacteriales bacterium TMED191]|nr:MAG: ABC transporter ATP-binding protein [Flavobacteriales bacterium TMED191]